MPITSCCPRCGILLPESASPTTDVPLCPACSPAAGVESSAPWWVAAAQPTLPAPSIPPPLPPEHAETVAAAPCSRRWWAAAAATLLLSGGFLFCFSARTNPPRTTSGEAVAEETLKQDRENIKKETTQSPTPVEAASSAVTLKPTLRLFDRPVSAAKRSSGGESDLLASSTPPPLPPPSSEARQDDPEKPDAPRGLHRLDRATEEELCQQAATAPEVGLGSSTSAVVDAYLTQVKANNESLGSPNLTDSTPLMQVRPDLRVLPLRFGTGCQVDGRSAVTLGMLSRKLHAYLDQISPLGADGQRSSPRKLYQALRVEVRGKRPEWLRAEAVPSLLQIFMAEEASLRQALVELLSEIQAPAATVALAQRAVFDFSPEVREAAVAALKERPAADYRPVLLKALRYPWAVPAQHAAEILAALKDTGSVPALVSLLKLSDPAGPLAIHKNKYVLQDVVRLRHLGNCLVCHPPATSGHEPVLGVDPVATVAADLHGAPLAVVVRQSQNGPAPPAGGYGGGARSRDVFPLLIRADITFLRQDFSVQLPVNAGTPNQAMNAIQRQRFDYVLRTRVLSRKQFERLGEMIADRLSYSQRDAVLFALRELTGKDAGPTTEAWVQMFPHAETDVEAARLSRKLLKLDGTAYEVLLAKCRDGEGEVYTQALACAISSLRGVMKEHVRGVLTERLARLSATRLREKLLNEDTEIRRAAVLACARKDKEQAVPDLIALLDNPEPVTARLAEEGLASITGEHLKHPAAWKDWWQKHGERGQAK